MASHSPNYLPDEADINYRGLAVQWFTANKWPVPIVDDIMYFENPTIETVERLVRRFGPSRTCQLISRINQ